MITQEPDQPFLQCNFQKVVFINSSQFIFSRLPARRRVVVRLSANETISSDQGVAEYTLVAQNTKQYFSIGIAAHKLNNINR